MAPYFYQKIPNSSYTAPRHHEEEWNQINFLAETAKDEFKTYVHDMANLEFDTGSSKLRALNKNSEDNREIKSLYKLYPLEWFCFEEIGKYFIQKMKNKSKQTQTIYQIKLFLHTYGKFILIILIYYHLILQIKDLLMTLEVKNIVQRNGLQNLNMEAGEHIMLSTNWITINF
jgi:hypothetical protein